MITTFKNAEKYLHAVEQEKMESQEAWNKYMIDPFWNEIAKWASFDQSFKKPHYIKDLSALGEQLSLLSEICLKDLQAKFKEIMNTLPIEDDDPMSIALYPLCDSNKIAKERQNGVTGVCVFGNMILQINPLADDYDQWIPYVFAHEYHHNAWGHYWFAVQGGQGVDGSLLEQLIIDGQADLFSESLFPNLKPKWNQPFETKLEAELWERLKPILNSTDQGVHALYMFGNENEGLPWCMGYTFGKAIVADYLANHPNVTFPELIKIPHKEIFAGSRFANNSTFGEEKQSKGVDIIDKNSKEK